MPRSIFLSRVQANANFNCYCQLLSTVGGFKLRKWTSNNRSQLEDIEQYEKAIDLSNQNHSVCKDEELTVLGLLRNQISDIMQLDISIFKDSLMQITQNGLTKSKVLQVTTQLYDPLGLLETAIAPMK